MTGGTNSNGGNEGIGDRRIDRVTRADLSDELAEVESDPLQNGLLATGYALWREAMDEKAALNSGKESTKGAGHLLSHYELERALESATADEKRCSQVLRVFLADTGCRLGEALNWSGHR